MKQKRILCINDISSMGKCSLTVALPVLSTMGIEAVVLPTAFLSAHTVFEGYTFMDNTEEMKKVLSHFENMGEKFDCIFTGYLGSESQIEIVSRLIDNHPESIIITDPVMGDNGKLYSGFKRDYPQKMAELCKKSHIILPNYTEAELLGDVNSLCKNTVVTGVREGNMVATYLNDKKIAESKFIDRQFHGAGDVFSSTFTGLYTLGNSLQDSIKKAVEFTEECISHTVSDKDSQWYGLRFEECLHKLFEMK